MDIGDSPNNNFSKFYQSGALSFEVFSNGKKLITNSGYFSNNQNKLNKLSKSTALQSTVSIEDHSSCNYKKLGKSNLIVNGGTNITKKNMVFEDNYWKLSGSHDGYLKSLKRFMREKLNFIPSK
jgi:uncharacterized heparinase superfamily protein